MVKLTYRIDTFQFPNKQTRGMKKGKGEQSEGSVDPMMVKKGSIAKVLDEARSLVASSSSSSPISSASSSSSGTSLIATPTSPHLSPISGIRKKKIPASLKEPS